MGTKSLVKGIKNVSFYHHHHRSDVSSVYCKPSTVRHVYVFYIDCV